MIFHNILISKDSLKEYKSDISKHLKRKMIFGSKPHQNEVSTCTYGLKILFVLSEDLGLISGT